MHACIWVFIFVVYILEKTHMGSLYSSIVFRKMIEITIKAGRISRRHWKKKGNMKPFVRRVFFTSPLRM